MEDDSEGQEEEEKRAGILYVPEEILIKILGLVDPFDVWSAAKTCKYLSRVANCESLWKRQWNQLIKDAPFQFPSSQNLQDLGVCFRDACRRLCSTICNRGTQFQKCKYCKEFTCTNACLEQRCSKNVMDIGGKVTWIITSDFSLRKHLSMIALPKVLRCYDCDATIDRGQSTCDCREEDSLKWNLPACRYKSLYSHTGLQYTSQLLGGLGLQPWYDQPLCFFCEEDKVTRLLCEKDMVIRTKDKLSTLGQPYSLDETFKPPNYSFLSNGYCQDATSVYGAENIDLMSPLIALEHNQAFPIVKAYIDHLIHSFKMIDDLQKPNSCLIFTEPSNFSCQVKEKLLRYLFEDIQIARLCFLPKALAISLLFERDNCIVVDSGATSTSVWVVLEGRVDPTRTRSIGVGGWHLSEFIKQALSWKETSDSNPATVSSLDTTDVKEKCRLSLNLMREEQRHTTHRAETLRVKSQGRSGSRGGGGAQYSQAVGGRPEYSEIQLSSELYLAPEMMYASLDLASMLVDATRDLPAQFIKDCFSNILMTGGNSDLQGLMGRLSSDLRDRLPEHSSLINISSFPTGNHSWNTAMGANMVKVPPPYEDILQLHTPGTPFWISREEYIIFGTHQLSHIGIVEEM